MKDFFAELKRRHVFRVGIAYLVMAWLVVQVVAAVSAPLHLPDWTASFIIVVLAVGFPIALLLTWGFEMTPEGVKRSDAAPTKPEPMAEPEPAISATVSTTPSIAVLPFVNMSADKDQEYFSDGLSEELLNKLAGLKGLRVAGRTSSFHFKGKNENLRTIAGTLGVAHILEGSVRKSGDKVRITAQLIDACDDAHLWSNTYERTLDDIFAIQDEIAEGVAKALSVTLGVGDLGHIEGMTRNVEAYDAYLRGRAQVTMSADRSTQLGQNPLLERAVQIDPNYAQAWAAIYVENEVGRFLSDPLEAAKINARAERALARAVEIAPDAADVLSASARSAMGRGAWTEADRLYRKAIDRHGNAALALDYGQFLLGAGKAKEALDYLLDALRIEPLSMMVHIYLCLAYGALGRISEALAESDRAESTDGPKGMQRGATLVVALAQGDRAEIKRRGALVVEADPTGRAINGAMLSLLDDPKKALDTLHGLFNDSENASQLRRWAIAAWAAYFGDTELALMSLKETVINNFFNLVNLWQPVLAETRRSPGFKDLLREIGLVDYWRETGWGDFCHPVGDNDFECE